MTFICYEVRGRSPPGASTPSRYGFNDAAALLNIQLGISVTSPNWTTGDSEEKFEYPQSSYLALHYNVI